MILFSLSLNDEEIVVEGNNEGFKVVERWKANGSMDELVEEIHGDPLTAFVEKLSKTLHVPPSIRPKLLRALKAMSPPITGRASCEGNTLNVVFVGRQGGRVTLRVSFSLS